MPEKKEHFFEHHVLDMANRCYQNGYPVFTDFMTTKEYTIFNRIQCQFPIGIRTVCWGGNEDCDHVVGGMFPVDFSGVDREAFPVSCIHVQAKNGKYAQELCHRDYLGAILNLGMERSQIGDIRVNQQSAFIFCKQDFASFIVENLSMIKHTSVFGQLIENKDDIPKQQYSEQTDSVASLRLDNVVAAMVGSARGKAADLIRQGYVIVSHEERTSVSFLCRTEMVFTIRGYGKYRLKVVEDGFTKKGKQKIIIYKYM